MEYRDTGILTYYAIGSYGFPLSQSFKIACTESQFLPSSMMLEVSISCHRRWMTRDADTAEMNLKSLAYRALLEEVLSPLLPAGAQLIVRGQGVKSYGGRNSKDFHDRQ